MIVFIKPMRKDGKTPIEIKFSNGVFLKKLLPNKEAASIEAFKTKFPRAEYHFSR